MTSQEAKQLLDSPIFRAFAEGKPVQYLNKEAGAKWQDLTHAMPEYFIPFCIGNKPAHMEYRIKPEPRTWWLVRYPYCGNTASQVFATKASAGSFIATNRYSGVKMELIQVKEVL